MRLVSSLRIVPDLLVGCTRQFCNMAWVSKESRDVESHHERAAYETAAALSLPGEKGRSREGGYRAHIELVLETSALLVEPPP
jgi:hypothetical protein